MIVGRPNPIREGTELDGDEEAKVTLQKRARYVQRCKDAWWSRWSAEYLKALREQHNMKNEVKEMNAKPGDVVLIKGDERNCGKWKIGIIDTLINGSCCYLEQLVHSMTLQIKLFIFTFGQVQSK